jgi:DNA-binding MarR family transcriptional regulator
MAATIEPDDYRLALDFRVALRRFLSHSDDTIRRSGLTPQRYLLLLAIKSAPGGREQATMGELGAALRLAQSSVTELVDRAESMRLVRRGRTDDRRVVTVELTATGERLLERAFLAVREERDELLRHLDHARRRLHETPA